MVSVSPTAKFCCPFTATTVAKEQDPEVNPDDEDAVINLKEVAVL